ncbi:MAG TPA: YhjD/YihY/BrkB family envelope integrity protein, partial [Candidatus Methylomirabilis sp.]|nr:YhjD/YihY/BrkB family envelope integrity protein [Candidatus Methylomirabilis sp.]
PSWSPPNHDWVMSTVNDGPDMGKPDGEEAVSSRHSLWRRLRARYEGSVVEDLVKGLGDVEFGDQIIVFGASFLLSVLPLIILLGFFANSRVDDNIATRLGLNREGSYIVEKLFPTNTHPAFTFGIIVSLALSLAGTVAVARSVQRLYQRVFAQPDVRGWSNVLRCLVWAVVAAGEVVLDAVVSRQLRDLPAGRIFLGLGNLVIVTAFFWWGLHFLLRGSEPWRRLFPAALITGVFWVGLGAFAAFYFSSTLVSDSHLYGTIGVVFTLVTWFIAMGAVITLGAVVGRVWLKRRGQLPPDQPSR